MGDIVGQLPAWWWDIPYDGALHPGTGRDLRDGANCQRFAYAVLALFGRVVPPLWSSELWTHEGSHKVQAPFEPLDLLLFNRSPEPFGAHVAVALGEATALHLSRRVGRPAVWSLDEFAARPEYAVLIGGKRFP